MPRKEERLKEGMSLGSGRVDFLLFVHDPTHPVLEVADILRDFAQLRLHLDLFLRPTAYLDGVLVQLLSEPNVWTDNGSFGAYEIDRGGSRHAGLCDEICADDGGASADSHYAVNQDFVRWILLQRIFDKRGGVVEMRRDLLPEVIRQPHVEFLDVVHLAGESWMEV